MRGRAIRYEARAAIYLGTDANGSITYATGNRAGEHDSVEICVSVSSPAIHQFFLLLCISVKGGCSAIVSGQSATTPTTTVSGRSLGICSIRLHSIYVQITRYVLIRIPAEAAMPRQPVPVMAWLVRSSIVIAI